MKKGIIGKKLGMTQIFDENGNVIPVTVIEAGPCTVVQKKTVENDGYDAVQLGFEEIKEKHVNKPAAGHFKKNGVSVNTSVGFNNAGYAPAPWATKRHKGRTTYKWNGEKVASARSGGKGEDVKPIPVIANAINSGTSFMQKQPFFRKGVSKHQRAAMEAMERRIKKRFEEYTSKTA